MEKLIVLYILFGITLTQISGKYKSRTRGKRFIDDLVGKPYTCNYNLMADTNGTILSPNFGNGTYPVNTFCGWLILAQRDKQVRLQFNSFSLESTRRCSRDNLRIYDGIDTFAPLLNNFCGQVIPGDVVSTGNEMLLVFHSDAQNEDVGFNITYSEFKLILPTEAYKDDGCHGDVKYITGSSGYISSPGYDGHAYYANRINCSWVIQAPPGFIVRLKFEDFITEKIAGCTYDYLAVYDGPNDSSTKLVQLCGLQFPDDLFSSGNQLFIHFTSDADVSSIGVNMTFERQPYTGNNKCDKFRCHDNSCVLPEMVCNNFTECMDGTDELLCVKDDLACGRPYYSPAETSHKIVGGREVIPHSWPWMVSLQLNGEHTCGGAIIDPYWIVSAAHCFEANRHAVEWTVVAGKHYKPKHDGETQTRQVERIIVHSHYNYITSINDISLVKVSEPFNFNNAIGAVCLPSQEPVPGQIGIVTGWGYVQGTCCPDVLKQVTLPVISRDICIQPDHLGNQVTTDMFCAGFEEGGEDACQGDSGGPFVMKDVHGVWRIQGVTSFGSFCAAPKSPGVYTKVHSFLYWIRQKMAINGM